ncbi:hypothetical protein [Bifidobacterium sp. ESL0704]|uniref:hypothetical protein n=1 Tax=Bifidobacterium sp. ESL0704 TaxID=2983219 RepID=UPI0023F77F28|nr:hypothetical protein [Bifidobacterium sp. ESL0704]WEV52981.1 hypothetical protein OZX64_00255 [Bifidobacterium sp. ESL0704]
MMTAGSGKSIDIILLQTITVAASSVTVTSNRNQQKVNHGYQIASATTTDKAATGLPLPLFPPLRDTVRNGNRQRDTARASTCYPVTDRQHWQQRLRFRNSNNHQSISFN